MATAIPGVIAYNYFLNRIKRAATRMDLFTLEFLGIAIDTERNRTSAAGEISRPASPVKVFVIPTDEELLIARDTYELVTSL